MYLNLERMKKALEDTRKQNGGRLAWCCARSPAPELKAVLTSEPSGLPPAGGVAAPTPIRAALAANALSGYAERMDFIAAIAFFTAFTIATNLVLLGPSSNGLTQPVLDLAYAFK